MDKYKKLFIDIMQGSRDSNIPFNDLRKMLNKMGAEERINGDHFIQSFTGIQDNINLQPNGNKAKSYQVKQVRQLFNKYGITWED